VILKFKLEHVRVSGGRGEESDNKCQLVFENMQRINMIAEMV